MKGEVISALISEFKYRCMIVVWSLYDCCMIVVWLLNDCCIDCCMIVVWLLYDCWMIVVWLLYDCWMIVSLKQQYFSWSSNINSFLQVNDYVTFKKRVRHLSVMYILNNIKCVEILYLVDLTVCLPTSTSSTVDKLESLSTTTQVTTRGVSTHLLTGRIPHLTLV